VSGKNAASAFIEVPIQDVMTTVFDSPMAPVDLQEAFGTGFLGGPTGDAVSHLPG